MENGAGTNNGLRRGGIEHIDGGVKCPGELRAGVGR